MTGFDPDAPVLAIGSAGIDIVGRALDRLALGTSNPSKFRTSLGGVARDVAENLARLGLEVTLISAVGDDHQGRRLLSQTARAGVNVEHVLQTAGQPTGSYLAILDDRGTLHLGMDDMRAINAITPEYLQEREALFKTSAAVFVDANLPASVLEKAISLAWSAGVPIAANPVSVALAPSLGTFLDRLWLITPNEAEAEALCPHAVPHADADRTIEAARHLVSEGVKIAVISMAEFGLGYASAESSGHVPALKTEILDPTGAGDALTAALIFALINGIPLDEAVRLGLSAAYLTLRTQGSVLPSLSLELLYDQLP